MAAPLEHFGPTPIADLGLHTTLLMDAHICYREAPAPLAMRPAAVSLWSSAVDPAAGGRVRLTSDGCVEISRSRSGTVHVFGPNATWSDLHLAAGQQFEGWRVAAGAGAATLRCDVRDLVGLVLDAGEFPSLAPLRDHSRPWIQQVGHVITDIRGMSPLVMRAAEWLCRGSTVAATAREVALSERELRRRFGRHVGLSPVFFRRLSRARRAVAAATRNPTQPLSQVAAECGFSDHAHLSREIRTLSGYTPEALLRDRGIRRRCPL